MSSVEERRMRHIIRSIMIAIPIIMFAFLFSKDFVLSGVLDARADIGTPSPFIAALWPPQRLHDPEEGKDGIVMQRMIAEPVTFAIRFPRKMNDVTIALTFQKDSEQPLHIGLRRAEGEWSWDIRSFSSVEYRDGWVEGSLTFTNIADYAGDGTSLDVMLNAPFLHEADREIRIRSVRVTATRDALRWDNIWRRGSAYLGRLL